MKHVIVEMGQRLARCVCGHKSEISQDEFLELLAAADDLLIDRHAAHAENMTERGL